MGKRKLVALLSLSSRCLMMVVWLFLAMPWGCPRFVIVVFPDNTHILFQRKRYNFPFEKLTCGPSIYTIDQPDIIVCSFIENSIDMKRVNYFPDCVEY